MTEEIIKECKNCDALGIDSEIGVYYCCLSHRQDDLPKEFTCNDFTPNNQLKRLEQKNKELKEENKQHIKEKQILNERLYCYAYEKDCHITCKQQDCLLKNSYVYRSALEKIRDLCIHYENTNDKCVINCYAHFIVTDLIQNKINEVLK